MATFNHGIGSDVFAQLLGYEDNWSLTSVASTKAVFEIGDFIVEVTGSGFVLGSPSAGTITGMKLVQTDLVGGNKTLITGTSLVVPFNSLISGFVNPMPGISPFDVLFRGNDAVNGSSGDDLMLGGAGADKMNGGDGNDQMFGDALWGDDASGGNDILNGGNGSDYLYGGGGRDSLTGGAGVDYLDGGTGADTMVGGSGDDYYVVDNAGDVVVESAGQGSYDRVSMSASAGFTSYTLAANVENLDVQTPTPDYTYPPTTTSPTVSVKGNALANKIAVVSYAAGFGGLEPSAVKIEGLGGNDRIVGGAGADTLDGGTGVDTMIGGAGNDTYVVDSLSDVVSESLLPSAGSDTIRFEVAGTTAVTVSLGGAVSGLAAGKTYANIENLTLGGTAAHNGIGSTAGNLLVGNAAANKLYGLNGNDTLIGGAGADALYGGAGNDRFVLSSAATSDTIGDFTSASDKLAVSQAGIRVGDGNTTVTSATVAGAGGFSSSAELVVVTGNIAGAITAASAAAKIGAASSAYTVGRTALFAVDNGADSALYLFTAANTDASVSASELKLLASLTGTVSTVASDYLFVS